MDKVYTTNVGVGLHGTFNVAMKLVCMLIIVVFVTCYVAPSVM